VAVQPCSNTGDTRFKQQWHGGFYEAENFFDRPGFPTENTMHAVSLVPFYSGPTGYLIPFVAQDPRRVR
jgi:hypothetical protein